MVEGGGGGSVIAAFFLAHNYVSEQFGNYVEYGMYFSRGRLPHISAVFAQSFCYSEMLAWCESESGASRSRACQSRTLTSVIKHSAVRYFNANIRDAYGHFSLRSTWHGSE